MPRTNLSLAAHNMTRTNRMQDIMARKGVKVPRLKGEEALSLWEEWKDQEK